jgi:protoporphyrinogen oxidase
MNLILGAGLSGLSCSYHLGHEKCLILEKNLHAFGHLHAEHRDGFTWDQGPHVSFTKHDYVRDLFAQSVGDEFEEYAIKASNYYKGHWIDHPAQSSLYQLPKDLRDACVSSFLESRSSTGSKPVPTNYAEWLEQAMGAKFSATFPAAYTRKYWTREPGDLTTEWIGQRVFYPKIEDVVEGSKGPLDRKTHYITKIRYPKKGGYQSFVHNLAEKANIQFGATVCQIDLVEKCVFTSDGTRYPYDRLVNTLPLPVFVSMCKQATPAILEASRQLSCSQLMIVNVTAPHSTMRPENWMYVYDEDKLCTRINCTEKLTSGNAPAGNTGVQAEVYFSRHKPLLLKPSEVIERVKKELVEMGLIDENAYCAGRVNASTAYAPWANVIFDHQTRPALGIIWDWLTGYGMMREADDLHPLTDWDKIDMTDFGPVVMAGRFGQWKYYWTDDCVLRGKAIGEAVN